VDQSNRRSVALTQTQTNSDTIVRLKDHEGVVK
jgi:hypothetical protein